MRIKDTPKINNSKTTVRQCVICGKEIVVKVFPDGNYVGGNYFSTIEQADRYQKTGETLDLNGESKAQIAEPVGTIKKWEYWECDKCYKSWEE